MRILYLSSFVVFAIGASAEAHANQRKLTVNEMREVEIACRLPAGSLKTGFITADLKDGAAKVACVNVEAKKRNVTLGFISTPVDPDK